MSFWGQSTGHFGRDRLTVNDRARPKWPSRSISQTMSAMTSPVHFRRSLLATFLLALTATAHAKEPAHTATWDVFFSPAGGCERAAVRELGAAKSTVYVHGYSFTTIAKALVDAHKRGVAVEIILDESNATCRYSSRTFMENARSPPRSTRPTPSRRTR